MRIQRIPLSDILHFIEVLAIVVAATFAGFQLRALRLQSSADFALRLGQELSTRVNQNLEDALDSDPTTPILKPEIRVLTPPRPGDGTFTVVQLDQYLSEYETLDDLYQSGLITCRMMYNEFSGDLEDTYKNKDVMAQVAKERKDDPTIWQGFLDLGRQFDNNYHCP
jgi:hypothetical protein